MASQQLPEIIYDYEEGCFKRKGTSEKIPPEKLKPIWGMHRVEIETSSTKLEEHIKRISLQSGANAYQKIEAVRDFLKYERAPEINVYAFQLYQILDDKQP